VTSTVSVVICAYTLDRWEQLSAAVQSVTNQGHPPDEVVVVIDHNDALLERARNTFHGVRVVASTRRKGLSGARNQGVREAVGEVVAFLDDDAAAAPDWLQHIVGAYQDSDVLGAGGWVEPSWGGERPAWFPEEFLWVLGCSYKGLPLSVSPVRNPIGANMSFRRDVIRDLGGFHEHMGRVGTTPLGCEETELSIRAAARFPRGKILILPRSVVLHQVPKSRTTFRYFMARCWAEGRSKALVSTLAGPSSALASERSYITKTLVSAVRKEIYPAVHGDSGAARRVASIIIGLMTTTSGYVYGRVMDRSPMHPPGPQDARIADRSMRHWTCDIRASGTNASLVRPPDAERKR
jgi:glycosyltransferase involved in cell wall biosynthesis